MQIQGPCEFWPQWGDPEPGPIPLIRLVWHKDANSPLHFRFLAPYSILNLQSPILP